MGPPWSVALLRHAEKGRRTSHKQLCGGPQCSVFRVCRRGRSLLCGGQGLGVGNGHAVDVVLDGVEVGVDGDGGAGLGHVLAVVGVVLPLGAQDLALGVVGAKVGVAVGRAGKPCANPSLKKRTPARVRGGVAHFDVRTHLSDNKSHYYNIKTQR